MSVVYVALFAFYVNAGLCAWFVHGEHYGPAVLVGLTAMHLAFTGTAAALDVTRTRRPMHVTVNSRNIPAAGAMVRSLGETRRF